MNKETHTCIGKINGMYINYIGKYNKEYVNCTIKPFRKLNNVTIGLQQQSIHHINYIFGEEDTIDKIVIGFRPMGIKPEDIDGIVLSKKKEKEGLTSYEQLLYGIWKYHYSQGRTKENKLINSIVRELHILKSKWEGVRVTAFEKMSDEYKQELLLEAEDIIFHITKYELG